MPLSLKLEKQITLAGSLSSEETKRKWRECAEKGIYGKPFCKYSAVTKNEREEFIMHYHSCYKKDWCDTMFSGEIYSDDESCRLEGVIKTPPEMKLFAVIFLTFCAVLGILYLFFPLFGYALYGFLAAVTIGIAVAFITVKIEKPQIDKVITALQGFINEE